jgi:dipeptidyl aminopeptidase/acylaminoacyl peptidase
MLAFISKTNNKVFKFNYLNLTIVLILFFTLPLITCPLWGQVVQKKQLSPADYSLWGEAHLDKISPDEKWASYNMSYQDGKDTLFVRNIKNYKTYHVASGYNSIFSNNSKFVCQTQEGLQIINLHSAKQETISGADQYSYCPETNYLIFIITSGPKKNTLIIHSLTDNTFKEITDVTQFSLSPKGHQLVYSTFSNQKNTLSRLDLKNLNKEKTLLTGSDNQFNGFVWQKEGRSLAFFTCTVDLTINNLYHYTIENDKLSKFNPETQPNFPQNTNILYDSSNKILISDDSQKVFFYIQNKQAVSDVKSGSDVEIWNANDKWIYTQEKKMGSFETKPKVALWVPNLNRFTPITSNKLPMLILTGDYGSALLSNPKDYEPQFDDEGPRDYYIMNLQTFEKKLFLQKMSTMTGIVIPSPTGKYIAYFKENNWWVYDILSDTHKNITSNTGGKFTAKERTLVTESVCGNPGWSNDDQEILLYDQYDLWAIIPNGSSFKRLTHGRESKIRFRIAQSPGKKRIDYIFNGIKIYNFNLETSLLLRAEGEDKKTGYFKWDTNTGEKPIVYKDSYVDELNYSSKKRNFFFREQKFDQSPELTVKNISTEPYPFFKSNPQQKKYFWGKSELIEYQNSKGQNLKGALFYPSNYDPQKKYPMIVNIYEIKSKELHIYVNPSVYNENGFNSTVFTSEGYFVYLPDIILEDQKPGISATDCVITAIKKIIEKEVIDPNKIGLMGHSFGGYETAFIITQTQMFAAAIASGAITDLSSFYHTVSQHSGQSDMYRFQTEQWRIGKTPYEAPLTYNANSPIMHVEKITTPLLLWTGKQDKMVDTHQSFEYYLALRRLGKKSIMLLYPNEDHLITNAQNQKDVIERMVQWFDYFLKDDKSSQWISDGTK